MGEGKVGWRGGEDLLAREKEATLLRLSWSWELARIYPGFRVRVREISDKLPV